MKKLILEREKSNKENRIEVMMTQSTIDDILVISVVFLVNINNKKPIANDKIKPFVIEITNAKIDKDNAKIS